MFSRDDVKRYFLSSLPDLLSDHRPHEGTDLFDTALLSRPTPVFLMARYQPGPCFSRHSVVYAMLQLQNRQYETDGTGPLSDETAIFGQSVPLSPP